jgi:DNA-binding SARP family transcriptional activator
VEQYPSFDRRRWLADHIGAGSGPGSHEASKRNGGPPNALLNSSGRSGCSGEVLSVEFGLLGPQLVRDGGRPVLVSAPRQRVLLAGLLLNAGQVVSLDALADMLWEGQPPAGARAALHSAIQRLRSTLGPARPALIATRPPGYVLQLGDGEFDVRQFGMLAARGQAAAEAGAWAETAGLLREALGLWRGKALADVLSALLQSREVPPLEDGRLQVLSLRIDADLRLGRQGELVGELRQLVAAHPLMEHFHAQLMLGLYRAGRQGDALAVYQDARRVLAEELGVDPGPELRTLHGRILAGDPGLLLAPAGQPPDGPPPGPLASAAAPGPPGAGHEPVVPRQLPVAARHFAGRADELKELARLAGEAGEAGRAAAAGAVHRRRPRRQQPRAAAGAASRRPARRRRAAGRAGCRARGRQRAGRVLLVLPAARPRCGAGLPAARPASRPRHQRPRRRQHGRAAAARSPGRAGRADPGPPVGRAGTGPVRLP